MKPIILLDLNYTLVANSKEKVKPFTAQIEQEIYREWLIHLLKSYYVIMITARPSMHMERTMASIKRKTGWQPDEFYFNEFKLPPAQCKEAILKKYVFDNHKGMEFLALESNPKTKEMYANYGIPSKTIEDGELWETL